MRHHVAARAVRPDAYLIDGGRAIRIGRRDEWRSAFLAQAVRHLPHSRRLAAAVHANDDHNAREGVDVQRAITLLQQRQHLGVQRGNRPAGIADVLGANPFAQRSDEPF